MKKIGALKKVHDPGLAEFVYTVATLAPLAARRHLPEKYYNKTRSYQAARRFAKTATHAEKMEFLSYLGYRSIMLISNQDTIWNPEIGVVLKHFIDPKKSSKLGDIINESVYVISDKRLFELIYCQTNIIGSPVYKMQMELLRGSKGPVGWHSKLNNELSEDIEKKETEIRSYIKVIYSGMEDVLLANEKFQITGMAFKIMLYLFLSKGKYVESDKIKIEMAPFANIKTVHNLLHELLEGLYIQQHFDPRILAYSITTRGIKTVIEFCEKAASNFKLL